MHRALVERAQRGDAEAFDALARTVGDRCFPGVKATRPIPSSIGGLDATYLELTMPKDLGCAPQDFGIFTVRPEWFKPGMPNGGTKFYAERDHFRIWLVEQGTVFLVAALYDSEATGADKAELQDVVDSLSLGIPLREMQFGTCHLGFGGDGLPLRRTLGTMDPETAELNGMQPVDEQGNLNLAEMGVTPPLARVDWAGEGWLEGQGTTGGAELIPPEGSSHTGFVTSNTNNGYQARSSSTTQERGGSNSRTAAAASSSTPSRCYRLPADDHAQVVSSTFTPSRRTWWLKYSSQRAT